MKSRWMTASTLCMPRQRELLVRCWRIITVRQSVQTSHGENLSPSFISGSICLYPTMNAYAYTSTYERPCTELNTPTWLSFKSTSNHSPLSMTLPPQFQTLTLLIPDLAGSSCASLFDPQSKKSVCLYFLIKEYCNARQSYWSD